LDVFHRRYRRRRAWHLRRNLLTTKKPSPLLIQNGFSQLKEAT
jgi:hypothetical protein